MPVPFQCSGHWRPSLFLQLSAAAHGAALAGLLLAPWRWPAWLALVVANHALITAAGLLPRCRWLGPVLTRLPAAATGRREVALTFDDGPDPAVTPQVLNLLEAAGARATFFCIGERVRAHPALARDIVRRGHQIENHTQHHPHAFSLYGPRRLAQEVAQAQQSVTEVTGSAPRFVRAVAGLRNLFFEPVLARQGLQLAAWTRRGYDTRDGDAQRVLARLTRGLAAGDVLLLHDGHAACTRAGVLPGQARLLDLGCGQAVLPRGCWRPRPWPKPGSGRPPGRHRRACWACKGWS